mmetsp:Transcript_66754/g.171879  ORF Transcript_66754/g.171879 Transcript_66754/m.171879 type:complete len:223 (-) Transcript_66754:164-832(-)
MHVVRPDVAPEDRRFALHRGACLDLIGGGILGQLLAKNRVALEVRLEVHEPNRKLEEPWQRIQPDDRDNESLRVVLVEGHEVLQLVHRQDAEKHVAQHAVEPLPARPSGRDCYLVVLPRLCRCAQAEAEVRRRTKQGGRVPPGACLVQPVHAFEMLRHSGRCHGQLLEHFVVLHERHGLSRTLLGLCLPHLRAELHGRGQVVLQAVHDDAIAGIAASPRLAA